MRFHAFQSIFLTIAWVVTSIALGIVASFGPLYMLYPLVNLAALILWVYLLLRTYQGQRVVLPIIGPLAEQQA